ncbi:MAG: HEPN domain-containing protein [Nanoarchaeota archaeon]
MDEEIGNKVFQQVIDLWVNPEIERRRKLGKIKEGIILSKIQIVFSLERGFNKVRFNEEVKAIAEAKANRKIEKGEIVTEKDIDEIKSIKLTDDDKNCAHITLLRFKDKWIIAFDARYHQKLRADYIEASKEFYESAIDNLKKGHLRVFYDNAFSSAELCVISILLGWLKKDIIDNKKHHQRYNVFKNFTDLGNGKSVYSDTLKELDGIRKSARYLASDIYKQKDSSRISSTLKEMIEFTEKNIE